MVCMSDALLFLFIDILHLAGIPSSSVEVKRADFYNDERVYW